MYPLQMQLSCGMFSRRYRTFKGYATFNYAVQRQQRGMRRHVLSVASAIATAYLAMNDGLNLGLWMYLRRLCIHVQHEHRLLKAVARRAIHLWSTGQYRNTPTDQYFDL